LIDDFHDENRKRQEISIKSEDLKLNGRQRAWQIQRLTFKGTGKTAAIFNRHEKPNGAW